MQGIQDPDTFELSEVVQKSSKTGIFTNNRLLMIKDGFLYYYTNVPSEYKTHEPNIMTSLKELPKYSIEIRCINSISLQSAKSTTLIISFFESDMIDRDAIRKSLTSKNYNHPVKPKSQSLEEWKFIFATVMRCRLWHGCLMKLKQHFVKEQVNFDKFTGFMANFDPAIRSSLPQQSNKQDNSNRTSIKNNKTDNEQIVKTAITSPIQQTTDRSPEKYKIERDKGIFEIQQTAEEHLQDTTPKAEHQNIAAKEKPQLNEELKDKMIKIEPSVKPPVKADKLDDKQKSPKEDTKFQKNEENTYKNSKHKNEQKIQQNAADMQSQLGLQKELQKQREKLREKKREKEQEQKRERQKEKQIQRQKDKQTQRDKERQIERERRQNDKERQIDRERRERQKERLKEIERQKEILKEIERQKEREIERQKERERERERQKQSQKGIRKQKQKEYGKGANKDKENVQKDKERQRLKIQEMIERIRRQQRQKAEQQQYLLTRQLMQKQNELIKLNEQLQSNRKMHQILQQRVLQQQQKRQEEESIKLMLLKEKRQEEEYKRLRESLNTETIVAETDRKTLQIKEESIQTETEKDIIDVIQGELQLSQDRNSRISYRSQSTVNQVNEKTITNLFRHTVSYISQVKLQNSAQIQNFDYYWQIGQIYKCPDLKDRIRKELELAEFTRKASRRVVEIITAYINDKKPKEPMYIDRHIFQIEIVCSRGKMIRTEGSQQLLYSNEEHQKLKRTFKIYNQLNETIIGILKKKHNYPLRVPFCCLVQYKGYTALAKIMPTLRPGSANIHLVRTIGQNIPTYNLLLQDFQTHGAVYSMIVPSVIYKPTKEDEPSIFRGANKFIDYMGVNRRANISINSKKLFEECKQIQNSQQQRTQLAEIIDFCRYFKKLMKASTPFADSLRQYEFLDDFIKNPLPLLQQHCSDEKNTKINGLILYYMEKMIGIRINGKFDSVQPKYSILPVTRQYGLCNLDVALFALSFDKYCLQKKYDLANKALNYRKYLNQDYSQILLNEAYLHIHQQQYDQALQKLQLSLQMVSQHDPKRMKTLELQAQCLEANGQQIESMASLKALLEQTEYIYGNDSLIEVYFLIADSLSRQRLIPQLTQVYCKILHDSPKYRQRVLVNFSQNLLVNQDMDPHVLLDFVSKQLSQQIENGQPLVEQLLGELYLRAKNKNKAQGYFTTAFNQFLADGSSFHHICQTFIKCYECCSSMQQRKSLHRQLYLRLNQTDFASSLYCKLINTLAVQNICQGYTSSQRDRIVHFVSAEKQTEDRTRLLEWVWLDNFLRCVVQLQQVSREEKSGLLFNIEVGQISQFCMILNSRNNAC